MNKQLQSKSPAQSPNSQVRMITVTDENAGQRLDNFLRVQLKGVPKTMIYRIIRKGEVRVNKGRVKADYKVQPGDAVRIPPVRTSPEKSKVQVGQGLSNHLAGAIVYEDKSLLIVNKPSGLAVHGGSGISLGLIEALRQLRPECRFLELVHRLDRDTSGCVMVAKKRSMLRYLHQELQTGGINKIYHTLVVGGWADKQRTVNAPLLKNTLRSGERIVKVDDEGKPSKTVFRVLQRLPQATLLEAKPITGRTHQIRVHAQYMGHPIAGDPKYGTEHGNKLMKSLGVKRLFLHAARLEFAHPELGALVVEAPLPDELTAVLKG